MGRSSTSLMRSSDERTGVFLRISTFGRFQIDWFDPATSQTTPLPPERLHGQNAGSALGLLKALLSCPDRFATRSWLNEQFWPTSKQKSAEERLNDVVSSLRALLRPKGNTDMFVHFIYGTNGRGAGFRLDTYPQLWCDADAFEWYVKHAMLLDQRQQDSATCWERAYLLAEPGIYLPEQIEDDWSRPRRDYLQGLLRDCVHRWTTLLRKMGRVDEAIMRLRSYWLEHPTDEDALRPLLEMLGDRERFGEAEEYYEKARVALAEDEHVFDRHTLETIEAVRALQIQRTPGTHYAVHLEETHVVEADMSLERGLKTSPGLLSSSLSSLAVSPSSSSPSLDIQHPLSSSSYRYLPYLRNP
ncbi:MAG TPA: BTAD domain-containing putative transcriptional regulator [Ktedonobacteraceae bacterium]|nr:BTAD domain-containing putative transcriptional regulator [Ktedonobacteraceae bacterium]